MRKVKKMSFEIVGIIILVDIASISLVFLNARERNNDKK